MTTRTTKTDNAPSMQFYVDDWLEDPALKLCSFAAQGLWMHMICRMFKSPKRGILLKANGSKAEAKHLAIWTGRPEAEIKQLLSELEAESVYSTNGNGCIFCRRLVRIEKQRQSKAEAGRLGGMVSKPPSKKEAKQGASYLTLTTTNKKTVEFLSEKHGEDAVKLSILLGSYIYRNHDKPKLKTPESWPSIVSLMIRKDQRTTKEIEKVIKWTQNDSFEMNNVLSMKKIRERWTNLTGKMKSSNQQKPKDTSERDWNLCVDVSSKTPAARADFYKNAPKKILNALDAIGGLSAIGGTSFSKLGSLKMKFIEAYKEG